MKKVHFRILSLLFFLAGIYFLLSSKMKVTGAVTGSSFAPGLGVFLGTILFLISLVLFFGNEEIEKIEDELDRIVRRHEPLELL